MISALTNHVWQSTLFAIPAGLLTIAFRNNRAKVRYWLWLSASLKFFIPFSLLMNAGSYLEWTPAVQRVAPQIAPPSVSITLEEISQPFPAGPPSPSSNEGHVDWAPITILGAWVCGFVSIAVIRCRDWRQIRSAVRASVPLDVPVSVEARTFSGQLEPGVVGVIRPILLLPEGIVGGL